MGHASVLLHESIDGLDLKKGEAFLDCTLGGGGHSLEVCRRFGNGVRLFGIDADQDAVARSKKRLLAEGCKLTATVASFRDLELTLDGLGVRHVDKVLFDLGISWHHYEESGRGFSFKADEPLIMTLRKTPEEADITAYDIVNLWDEENIATILFAYGDERHSRRIARKIVEAREEKEIKTTSELVDVILRAVPAAYRRGKLHPATRTFQALRIAVNDEIEALKTGLAAAWERVSPGGRIAVISFHSGEDRVVKNMFRAKAKDGSGKLLSKKPITPTDEEIRENPRSRSAKLRIIEKI